MTDTETPAVETPAAEAPEVLTVPEVQQSTETDRDRILRELAEEDSAADRVQQFKQDGIDEAALKEDEPKSEEPKTETPKAPTPEDLAAERKKLETERLELEARKRELDQAAIAAKKEVADVERQAEQLEEFAKDWDAEGNKDLAKNARDRAANLRRSVEVAKAEASKAEFRQKQSAVLADTIKEFPDLAKPESEMFRQMDALLKAKPHLLSYPEGIRDAATFVSALEAKGRLQAVQTENETLKQRVADLERKLRPATGKPTATRTGETSFEQLTPDQQRARLLRTMQRMDVAA